MFYEFPIITNIKQAYEAIAGREEFVVADRGDHIIFNYAVNFADTFPEVTSELLAVRRELRGLMFSKKTGKVISRPFHKFFNLNERPETLQANVDFSVPHIILDKMDGSFVRPFITDGVLRFGTKMGLTDITTQVERWLATKPEYIEFANLMIKSGLTPTFEWCSRRQRIVIDYPVDRLVLTNIRDMVTGETVRYSQLQELGEKFGIEVVKAYDGSTSDLAAFMEHTRGLEDQEGYVIRFENGHMLKVKAELYMQLHRALDNLQREKDVLRLLVADKLDDAKAFLNVDMHANLDRYHADFYSNLSKVAEKAYWEVHCARDNIGESRKRFATEFVPTCNIVPKGILFKIWENLDQGVDFVQKQLLDHIGQHTSTQTKVDSVKYLFGDIDWFDYYIRTNADLD